MNRRHFLKGAAALTALPLGCAHTPGRKKSAFHRVRSTDPDWPSASTWDSLNRQTSGRLIKLSPPAPNRPPIKNPFSIGNDPALTQNAGWQDAWTSVPSAYAVAAESAQDVVAAVNFAREHNLRLVVKGGGHSYQGTSCAPDSLLIWTRRMNQVALHDAFVPQGCEKTHPALPAASIGSGAVWMDAYAAVVTKGGRYIQGGGCTTVGVAGLIQSGGFGNFSKNFGMAAAALLEAEVVTADGALRIANARQNPDLFWALKGGGGGSFGAVTRVTLKTRDLPTRFGGAFGSIKASSDTAFRTLIARALQFYKDQLLNPHWGEQIVFQRDNTLRLSLVFQGLTRQQAEEIWRPFFDWCAKSSTDFSITKDLFVIDTPARDFWNAEKMRPFLPTAITLDDRAESTPGHFYWTGDGEQAGWTLHGYNSTWLPAPLLQDAARPALADAIFSASRLANVSLHFNKGLAGAPPEEIAAAKNTATNPAVLDAFALAIIASAGNSTDANANRNRAREIHEAGQRLRAVVPNPGSYVSESDYFESAWQQSFWGPNYPRLASIKNKYDPHGLFFVRHGVGSESWSLDGFTHA